MADSGNKRKARDKAFYIKSAKQARRSAGELGPGIKGFLCTSNREKDSVREAYNVRKPTKNDVTFLNYFFS